MGLQSSKLKKARKRFASIDNLDARAQEKKNDFQRNGLYGSSRAKWKFSSVGSSLNKAGKGMAWPDSVFLPEFEYDEHRLDRYKVDNIVANGAFGNVLRGRESKSSSVVAIKVLNKARVVVEDAIRQVKDEASIQFSVGHHPFIVQTLDYWQSKKDLYIVMSYIAHGELFLLWQIEERFSEEVVRIIIAELALVIDFLHQANIVYRDIKMENILLDDDCHVKVIDFGLARWLRRGDKTRTVCGTLQYMAPEVLAGEPYGHPVDWWSLGVLMYALLAGTYPVPDINDHAEMIAAVNDHEYNQAFPDCHSWEAREVIGQLLQKDPRRRLCDVTKLEKQEFFEGVDFTAVLHREMCPKKYLSSEIYFLDQQKKRKQNGIKIRHSAFEDFTWSSPGHDGLAGDDIVAL